MEVWLRMPTTYGDSGGCALPQAGLRADRCRHECRKDCCTTVARVHCCERSIAHDSSTHRHEYHPVQVIPRSLAFEVLAAMTGQSCTAHIHMSGQSCTAHIHMIYKYISCLLYDIPTYSLYVAMLFCTRTSYPAKNDVGAQDDLRSKHVGHDSFVCFPRCHGVEVR